MVVFACNHCGESVKKNQVDRHYQFKCRNAPISVSCMDCQKDFREKQYEAHTSCITEAEKYSGKDYVPKPSYNAGQRKQEDWIDIVRSVLSSSEQKMSGQARRHLQKLLDYSNVPRKKPKFINFVGNSLRIKRNEAEELWNIMEVAIEKFKTRNQKHKTETKPSAGDEESTKIDMNEEKEGNVQENGKAKKKKRPAEDDVEAAVTTECTEEAPAKKKKKKSKEAEQQEVNGQENGSGVANGTAESTETETGKKKKKSEAVEARTTENGNTEEVEDKSSKKNKKLSMDVENAPLANGNVPSDEKSKQVGSNTVAPFDWTNTIFDIVEKNNNEMDVENLKKKVLKKYLQCVHQTEPIPWKVEKTFNKKLKKSGLLVEGNLVKSRIK